MFGEHESASGGAWGAALAQSASASPGFRSSSGSGNVASRGVIHRPPSARVCSTLRSTIAAHVARTAPAPRLGRAPAREQREYAATVRASRRAPKRRTRGDDALKRL